ncbi:MAG: hypothetical protein AAFX45_09535 [Pseudomonadota bacterium]
MKTPHFILAAALLAASPVSAATIIEGGADFGDDVATAFVGGPLDVGANTIAGGLSRGFNGEDLVDTVEFTIADDTELVGASFTPFASGFFDIEAKIADQSGVTIVSQLFGPFGGGSFLGGTILGAGTYYFQTTALSQRGEIFDAGYSAAFTVAETTTPPPNVVPLPASAPLVLGGLALLGGLGRFKRRKG